MAVSHRAKPAAAVAANGPCKNDRLAGATDARDTIAKLKAQRGRLVDRYGKERHPRVLDNWSREACVAMGLHRARSTQSDLADVPNKNIPSTVTDGGGDDA